MGLFNIFKRKEENIKQNRYDLEILLQKAATEPAYRAEFYKRILSDNLIVITQDNVQTEGVRTLEKDTHMGIVSYSDGKIPVFTSTQRIFDKGIVKEEVKYLEMKGEDLFKATKGSTLVLNPYSDYGKELLPNEVEELLKGTILTNTAKTVTIPKDTEVILGQPAKYPTEIVSSLKELFSTKPSLKAAYIGWIHDPSSGEPPHYIFGLDTENDFENLVREAGFTAKEYLKPEEFVDFVNMRNRSSAGEYLKNTTPFYKK